jgi:hypothetical protein
MSYSGVPIGPTVTYCCRAGVERAAIQARVGAGQSLIKSLTYASSNDNDLFGEQCAGTTTALLCRVVVRLPTDQAAR